MYLDLPNRGNLGVVTLLLLHCFIRNARRLLKTSDLNRSLNILFVKNIVLSCLSFTDQISIKYSIL